LSMFSMLFRRNWLPSAAKSKRMMNTVSRLDSHTSAFFTKTTGIGYPLPYSSPRDFGMRPNSDTIPSLHEDRGDPHALWAQLFVGGGEVIG